MRRYLIFLSLLSLTSCEEYKNKKSSENFKNELTSAISRASKVEIVEHSWINDYNERDKNDWGYEYKTVELDSIGIADLIKIVRDSKYDNTIQPKLDIVSYHHSIRITDKESISYLMISVGNDNCEWSGSSDLVPSTLARELTSFIKKNGFDVSSSDAHWKQKLNDHQPPRDTQTIPAK